MKIFFAIIIAFLTFSSDINAEKFKFSEAKLCTGKNPFFSGFDSKITLKSSNKILMMSLNNVRGNTRFGYSFSHVNILATGGVQRNAPWLGPEVDFKWKNISTLHWFGWIFGQEGFPKWENPSFFFALNAIYFNFGNISLSHTILHKGEEKSNNMPGLSFQKSINKYFTWTIGADYSLKNKSPLFNLGIKFVPPLTPSKKLPKFM